MAIRVGNLIIGNTVIDQSNTTPEEIIYDLHHHVEPEMMPLPTPPDINKYKILGQHLKKTGQGPHLKSYLSDMITPTLHFKKGYKIKGLEKLHRKSLYVSEFLKE